MQSNIYTYISILKTFADHLQPKCVLKGPLMYIPPKVKPLEENHSKYYFHFILFYSKIKKLQKKVILKQALTNPKAQILNMGTNNQVEIFEFGR